MKELDTFYLSIGKKIREIRNLKGITLEELAEKVGRDWSFLSQIERGKSVPSIKTLYLICNALSISLSDLFQAHKSTSYKTDPEIDKLIWLMRDKSLSEKKIVTNVVKHILKKKK
ncbi:MAG: helix-turn-helix transcriptional regulator [Elusimicrobia bacterium]|nr:helix-turn-helix transcriptional regulator [Elusimicrobiota bacterium]